MRAWRAVLNRDLDDSTRLEYQVRAAFAMLLVVAVSGAYFAWTESRSSHLERLDTVAPAAGASPRPLRRRPDYHSITVRRATEARERWTDAVPARIRLNERRTASVGSPVQGRVTHVFAQSGHIVRAGAPLFAVAGPQVPEMVATSERAAHLLAAAKVAENRVVALVRAGALPAKEEASAKHEVAQAKLAHLSASTRIQTWTRGKSSGELIMRSPVSGTVIEKKVLAGQTVDAGEAGLMVVADTSNVWVTAEVLESDALDVSPGTRSRVFVTLPPESSFEANVEAVSPVVDRERHSIWVRMELENPKGRLRPNAMASVQFLTNAPPASVEVPSSAILTNGSEHYVYVEEQSGAYAHRSVVIGATRGGLTTVVRGLSIGDSVVERGSALLDNAKTLSD